MRYIACLMVAAGLLSAQVTADILGVHDLSRNGKSPVNGGLSGACYYCHAPHSGIGGLTPLWNQKLSTQTYSTYTSSTSPEVGQAQPPAGSPTLLCLSCHDGTVAPGQTQAYGSVAMSGSMKPGDVFGANLQSSHPNSLVLPLKDSPDLAASLVSSGQTLDPTHAVKLIKGNVECTSCHAAHVQTIDPISQNFLVRDSSNGQMCLACHDPNRVTNSQPSRLAQWATSAHAIATNTVAATAAATLGGYHTVGENACISCHKVHNAPVPARLLQGPNEQDCVSCHNGGTNISPAMPNVFAEFSKGGHPFPSGNNLHDAAEAVLLNQNRHATCADCHNAHSSARVESFTAPPAVRLSQNNVTGISASDGITVMTPAANQFENCLRCHGNSTGKVANPTSGYLPRWAVSAGDPLNVISQFALASTSSHPVTHDRSSGLPQPSLRLNMLNLNGVSSGRTMGLRILCTDCHNSDDNREFGGAGPNGPHGSRYPHIFERRYEFSIAVTPGSNITNLFPNPDLSVAGPYALCGKCHDLSQIVANTSFLQHARHINDGFSCSTCHTGHGMGNVSGSISGQRMVNFDINVVAPNGANPLSYNRDTNTCTLMCHGQGHPAATQARPLPKATK
ncbi:MAG: cytochrome c3 family protein [Bryobacteraceae bacterium]